MFISRQAFITDVQIADRIVGYLSQSGREAVFDEGALWAYEPTFGYFIRDDEPEVQRIVYDLDRSKLQEGKSIRVTATKASSIYRIVRDRLAKPHFFLNPPDRRSDSPSCHTRWTIHSAWLWTDVSRRSHACASRHLHRQCDVPSDTAASNEVVRQPDTFAFVRHASETCLSTMRKLRVFPGAVDDGGALRSARPRPGPFCK